MLSAGTSSSSFNGGGVSVVSGYSASQLSSGSLRLSTAMLDHRERVVC